MRLPSLTCDYFQLTKTGRAGHGRVTDAGSDRPGGLHPGGSQVCDGEGHPLRGRGGRPRDGASEQRFADLGPGGRRAPGSCGIDAAAADSRDHRGRAGAGGGRLGRHGAGAGVSVAQDWEGDPPGPCENPPEHVPQGTPDGTNLRFLGLIAARFRPVSTQVTFIGVGIASARVSWLCAGTIWGPVAASAARTSGWGGACDDRSRPTPRCARGFR